MKNLFLITFLFLFASSFLKADDKTVYTKEDINSLAANFIFNNINVKNPVVVDVDGDGVFDILNFSVSGDIEYYKNTGTNENPDFILENPNYSDVKVHKVFKGMPVPVFFADATGNGNLDVFAVMSSKYDVTSNTFQHGIAYHENTLAINHYTLITIILVLLIVVLIIAIL